MAKIFFCGDIINQFYNTQFVGTDLCDIINGCDYAVCNLEGVVANDNEKYSSMKQNSSTVKSLCDAGFNLILLANNHITDYGKSGLSYTIDCLHNHELEFIGAGLSYEETYQIHYFSIACTRFALLNICEAQGGQYDFQSKEYGYAWIGAMCIESLIKEARSKADRVIMCIHAGLEHYNLPLEQFREMYKHYCDLGVDVIVGSHPHIVQGIESYNGSLIFYSLGNFFFPRNLDADYMIDKENQAFSVILSITKSELSYEIIYHRIEKRMVQLAQKTVDNDPDRLSAMLGEDYPILMVDQLKDAFYRLPMNLLRISLNGISYEDGFLQKIKTMIRYFVNCKEPKLELNNKMKLLNHVINNETYRFLLDSVIKRELYL